ARLARRRAGAEPPGAAGTRPADHGGAGHPRRHRRRVRRPGGRAARRRGGPHRARAGRRAGGGGAVRPAALLRLALAGSRTDTVRIVLTAFAAALATLSMLAAATVYAIRPRADVAVREAADHDPTMPGVDPAPDGYAYQYTHNLL